MPLPGDGSMMPAIRVQRGPRHPPECEHCGYSLAGHVPPTQMAARRGVRCPECGRIATGRRPVMLGPSLWFATIPPAVLIGVVSAFVFFLGDPPAVLRFLLVWGVISAAWPTGLVLLWAASTSSPGRPRNVREIIGAAALYSLASWTVMLVAVTAVGCVAAIVEFIIGAAAG